LISHSARANHAAKPALHWQLSPTSVLSAPTSIRGGSTGTTRPGPGHRRRRRPGLVPLEPTTLYLAIGADVTRGGTGITRPAIGGDVDHGWFHWNHPPCIWPSAPCRPGRRHWSHKEMSRNSSVFSVVMWLEKATTSDAYLEHWKLYQSTGASHATKATTHRPGTVRAGRTLALPSQLENMACSTRRRCVAGLDLGSVWNVLAGVVKATTKSSLAG